MTKLNLILQPQERGKIFTYNYCACNLEIILKKALRRDDVMFVSIYNDQLMLMKNVSADGIAFSGKKRNITIPINDKHIWLPGAYFLILRDINNEVFRYDARLDEKGIFHIDAPRPCPKMSDEDMLSRRLMVHRGSWTRLSTMPGAMQLKRWVIERAKQNELNELREKMQQNKLPLCNYMLVTGKESGYIGPAIILLMHVGQVDTERKYADLDKFFDFSKTNPYEAMNEYFSCDKPQGLFDFMEEVTKPKTYVYSKLNSLMDTGGKTIVKAIHAHWPNSDGSVIFHGTQQEIDTFMGQNPSFQRYFPEENKLSFEPYTREEMIHFFFALTELRNLTLSAEAVEKVCRLMTEAYEQGLTSHWDRSLFCDYVDRILMRRHLVSAVGGLEKSLENGAAYPERGSVVGDWAEVQPSDIDENFFLNPHSTYNDAMRELNAMVGLQDIKRNITTLSNRTKFFQERRLVGLHCSEEVTFHTILTGNPGTGKTTVAKLLGKIYHSLGLLSKGDVVYADRSTIVGRYIGETEENMKQLLQEAQGNVLFIDEAYTLYTRDDTKDFGRHAVECLLDVLGRKNPDMLVVFAGYKKEMDALMSMNPGLVGRFPYKFHFSNYKVEELLLIAERMLAKDQYELSSEARVLLQKSIRDAASSQSESFANARWVEQFVRNGVIPALADRVAGHLHPARCLYTRIEAADVRAAAERFNPRTIELKRRPAIGFCA
ncbi:MAG: AAA family ATPase [Bacteroidaceae bacterium]|nr:AAA family ATPase [Bacteroidaceae bacterium]